MRVCTFGIDVDDLTKGLRGDGQRGVYRGHLLSWRPVRLPDGRYRTRVVVISLGGDTTVSQHFLDLTKTFTNEDAAARHARSAGEAWVDRYWTNREPLSTLMAVR